MHKNKNHLHKNLPTWKTNSEIMKTAALYRRITLAFLACILLCTGVGYFAGTLFEEGVVGSGIGAAIGVIVGVCVGWKKLVESFDSE